MRTLVILLALLLVTASNLVAGGPWTQAKGEGIFIANISPVVYKTYSSSTSGGLDMWRRIAEVHTQGYIEFGITDRLLLLGNVQLNYVGSSNKTFDSGDFMTVLPPDKIFGMGNSSVGLKYRLTNKNFLIALSFHIEFPGSSEKTAAGLRTGYDAWTFLPGVHMGQGFSNGIYYFIEGSFAGHTNISDEYRLKGEFGYHFKKPLIMAVAVNVKESLKNKTSSDSPNYRQTGLYLNNQEYITWEFKFVHEVTETIGWTSALAGGFRTELIARTPVISFGMYFKWDKSYADDMDDME